MDRQIIEALVKAVEVKDESTVTHTWRVALYSQALAERMAMTRDEIHRVMNAAVLHDIGKIDIPYEILAKPGRLDEEEMRLVKQHTILGFDRLKRMGETDEMILALVRSHHERLDGSGYPDGLAGEDIPEAARVFAVIDTFDAMTSIRPYRSATDDNAARRAIEELNRYAGIWYCPDSVLLFTELFESGALEWIRKHFNDEKSMAELASGPDAETIEIVSRHLSLSERNGAPWPPVRPS